MIGIVATSILCSIGLGVSSFFGFFLLKHNKLENRLLAWLLITLSLRITKSIFYAHLELPLIIKNLGLAANLSVGPLLFLYVITFLGRNKLHALDKLHFIPTLFYIAFSPILPNGGSSSFWLISYSIILIQSFTYVFITIYVIVKASKDSDKKIRWIWTLAIGLGIMWLVYALIFIQILPLYILGPFTFSLLVFILLSIALDQYQLFIGKQPLKYANSRITDEKGMDYFERIETMLLSKELYKKTDISLSFFAEEMGILERDISMIINRYGESNFSQYINSFRIKEAIRLMEEDSSRKLIAIAYDSGFSNLSTFNKVFKSATGYTPSEFKKN